MTRSPAGVAARGQSARGSCQQVQPPAIKAADRHGYPRAWESTMGIAPAGAAAQGAMVPVCPQGQRRPSGHRGNGACPPIGGATLAPRRWSLDEGRKGGLGYPFEKRMIMPLKI
ncbi:hypothetical protein B296_00027799 [Ensete ventricosum]|uniref:Uncharacterized protein n=1 Tax=Ensete ventricosum TaxID=4639 RepID=A0A426Y2U9_ENSVE|nr:hypothetical protein B296_00027799 [Ensete ventricosum]